MKSIREYLEELRSIPRRKSHLLTHKIHLEHGVSKRTLLYVKEYGPHSNVPRTIIKESIAVLLFASLLSSFGGFALESIKDSFISLMPLIILLPVLNDMIGDYGTIISSRISTILHRSRGLRKGFQNKELKTLYLQIEATSFLMVVFASLIAFLITFISREMLAFIIAGKIFLVALIDVIILVNLIFFISVIFGLHFYKKGEDPDNFLIPITTSIADFGSMAILALLIFLVF